MKPLIDEGVALARVADALAADREALLRAQTTLGPAAALDYARISLAGSWALIADLLADRNAYAEQRATEEQRAARDKAAIVDSKARLAEAETALDDARGQVARLRVAVDQTAAEHRSAVVIHEAAIARYETLIAGHAESLAAVHNHYASSKSWRLTAPLRRASDALTRAR